MLQTHPVTFGSVLAGRCVWDEFTAVFEWFEENFQEKKKAADIDF